MPPSPTTPSVHTRRARLSLDLWAVLFALALALLVRLGLLRSIPW